MRQPKYSFGQVLLKEMDATIEGTRHKVSITHVIVGIEAAAGSNDFYYNYKLASQFPSGYYYPNYVTDWVSEDFIDKIYKADW